TTLFRSKALIGGTGPSNRSISTRAIWPVEPCASREVPMSRVSTFGLPWTQNGVSAAGSCGSYQAPVASWTTPGHGLAQHRAGEAGAALVIKADDVAAGDAARGSVIGMKAHRLAAIHFR